MTLEQRNSIFAKECLTISDVMLLFSLSYDAAEKLIRDIKRKSDRLHLRGRVHIQDYLDYFGLSARHYSPEAGQDPAVPKKPEMPKQAPSCERRDTVELIRSKNYIATDDGKGRRSGRRIKIQKEVRKGEKRKHNCLL